MTITIGIWIIPAMLTVFIWLWFMRDVGTGFLAGVFEAMIAALCIAIMWAVYFAIRYFVATWGV